MSFVLTKPDFRRFDDYQNVIFLSPVMGLEQALTAVFGDQWRYDRVDQVYLVAGKGWTERTGKHDVIDIVFIDYFWIEGATVRCSTQTFPCSALH